MSWRTNVVNRRPVVVGPFGDGRTTQADAKRVSISAIVARALKSGGNVGNVHVRSGEFKDVSSDSAVLFLRSMNVVAQATSMFERLPARLRDRFNNDPRAMLAFVDDPANKEDAIKLGLLEKEVVPPPDPGPMKVEIVNSPPVDK